MSLEKLSPCKVNLLLNILGKRPDGYHELETVMQPVRLFDRLRFEPAPSGVALTCNDPRLPTGPANLVHRAATALLEKTGAKSGVRIHLEKSIPIAAGLGGGSGNAAFTLSGVNELLGSPLNPAQLHELAAALGSDVPFFLQDRPALAVGRGEQVQSLAPFPALRNTVLFLIHPGFGISTAWAYQNLARFPQALNGTPGRAKKLIGLLQNDDVRSAGREFYNSLEAPALEKHPLLALFQEFLREHGAAATLMSGSGSTTFAIIENKAAAEKILESFKAKFGTSYWTALVDL
ncbi:MAG: 4-(cytidine 5'-diphospho)-2-C-methyl-D-erythritol kinase [Verrucomicrobiota bacterium]